MSSVCHNLALGCVSFPLPTHTTQIPPTQESPQLFTDGSNSIFFTYVFYVWNCSPHQACQRVVLNHCEGWINTVNNACVYINKHVLIGLLMSITGCPGLLAGDVTPLKCTVSAIRGLIGARQERVENSTRSLVFYTSATSLLLCLSHSGYGFPLPYLVVFCLSLSPSFCLVVILALTICFAVRHTQRRREAGRETVLKKSISKEGKHKLYTIGRNLHASIDISEVMFQGCFHRDIADIYALQHKDPYSNS